ncbi:MAG TPA: hypothetical protein VGD78_01590 [Chthoniobacterales bacterium]
MTTNTGITGTITTGMTTVTTTSGVIVIIIITMTTACKFGCPKSA